MQRILEQRRREKEDDKRARQRVREQIEADKAARKAKAAGASNQQTPPTTPNAISPTVSSPIEITSSTAVKKDYNQTKLQVRNISKENGKNFVEKCF